MRKQQFPRLKEFIAFIKERQAIHERRLRGESPPWTEDPILQKYRFTNVKREDDRVTRWIHEHWILPHQTDYDTVVFAACLARLVNLPSTLEELQYPTRWDARRFVKVIEQRSAAGLNTYNNAYMINAVGATKGQSKASYLATCVLPPLWAERKSLGDRVRCKGGTLRGLHNALLKFHGFGGGFMAAQVVADVKFTPAGLLARDWSTFAVSGPGSRRGLNWLMGREPTARWREEDWYAAMMEARALVLQKLPEELRELSAQNTQNCFCEFSKYCKVKYLGLRAKQTFTPSTELYT